MRKSDSLKSDWVLFLKKALLLAEKAAQEDEVPVGAVVVVDNQIVGRGYNQREAKQNPCGHAELLALQAAAKKLGSWRLIGATVVVTLEPCPMCLAACQQARVSRVVYGAEDLKGGALSLGYFLNRDFRLNHRFEVIYEAFSPASEILKEFFRKKRSRHH